MLNLDFQSNQPAAAQGRRETNTAPQQTLFGCVSPIHTAMNSNDWHKIKEEIYYSDGSWRDIYVFGTTKDDWGRWIDLINQKYTVEFYNGQTQKTEAAINKEVVFDYWDRKTDLLNGAAVTVGNISVKCHFFTPTEIENDIDPKEIATLADHNQIISYLVDVSSTLNKTVVLTAENQRDVGYIVINTDKVQINVQ